MVVVVLSVTGGGLCVGSAVVARHRAQAAADLAALTAAARLPAGPDAACRRATQLARQMHVDRTNCSVQNLDVVITVQLTVPYTRWAVAQATARAGPAQP